MVLAFVLQDEGVLPLPIEVSLRLIEKGIALANYHFLNGTAAARRLNIAATATLKSHFAERDDSVILL